MPAVSVAHIVKRYGKTVALDGVSFEVEKGELFGIIGPDGAGKTTLFRIIATLILADSGTATVDGFDVVRDYKELRKRIGYMPGRFSLYQDLTVEENLSFFAAVFGTTIEENYRLVEGIYKFLEPFRKRRAGKLSGGMKQKLALCCALIHKPDILYLDEPTTGVDPVSRKEFWEMLGKLQQEGITIVVSTPYMDEANLCDRIALIKGGRFLEIDTPQNIRESFSVPLWAVRSDRMHRLLDDVRAFPGVDNCYAFGETHHFTSDAAFDAAKLCDYLHGLGHGDVALCPASATIEDCYMLLARQ
ncbi:MAG TPA: ABC transporter ATP-binding protein [Candidatus Tidjanibacter gallistercoris]|nr:ABC transporter ATP-binding protein [Candidatus Tidjanibacter gallistercoris]